MGRPIFITHLKRNTFCLSELQHLVGKKTSRLKRSLRSSLCVAGGETSKSPLSLFITATYFRVRQRRKKALFPNQINQHSSSIYPASAKRCFVDALKLRFAPFLGQLKSASDIEDLPRLVEKNVKRDKMVFFP